MRLVEIYIGSFGKFKDFEFKFDDDFTLICEPNSFGKSTIAAFIKAMFYGLKPSGNNTLENDDRTLCRPWKSIEKFGGTLTFKDREGKLYRIERYFGKTPKDDELKVFDVLSGKSTNVFGADVGFNLFGLDADAFERCLYVPQKQIKMDARDNFAAKINNLVESTDDANNFQTAVKKLDEFASEIKKKTGNKGKLPLVTGKIYDAESALEKSKNVQRQIEVWEKEIEEFKQSLVAVKAETDILNNLIAEREKEKSLADKNRYVFAIEEDLIKTRKQIERIESEFVSGIPGDDFFGEMSVGIAEASNLKNECEVLKMRLNDIEKENTQSAAVNSKPRRTVALPVIVLAALTVLFGALTCLSILPLALGLALAALSAVAAAAIFIMKRFKTKTTDGRDVNFEKQLAEINSRLNEKQKQLEYKNGVIKTALSGCGAAEADAGEFYTALQKVKNNLNALSEAKQRENELAAKWAEIEREFSPEQLNNAAKFDEAEYQNLKRRRQEIFDRNAKIFGELAMIEERLKNALEGFESVSESENRLDGLKEQKSLLEYKYNTAIKAIDALKQAKSNLAASYLPKMRDALQSYFSGLTKTDNFKNISINEDFEVSVFEDGASREIEYFSTGIKEICMFCLRFALIDTIFKYENPFIIFDDPFVNVDEGRLVEAGAIIARRVKTNQVIYFTCHERLKNILVPAGGRI